MKQWHWYLVQGVVFLVVGVSIWISLDTDYVWYSVVTLVVVFTASFVGFLAAWREQRGELAATLPLAEVGAGED